MKLVTFSRALNAALLSVDDDGAAGYRVESSAGLREVALGDTVRPSDGR